MEESSNNDQSSNQEESFRKKHGYSIITAVIIALLTCGYLFYILPNNKAKEDAKNVAVLQGMEQQLNAYIDDQVKYISKDQKDSLELSNYKNSSAVYIDTIIINKEGRQQLQDGTIKLSRKVILAGKIKSSEEPKNTTKNSKQKSVDSKRLDTLSDTMYIDLTKFLTKINATTQFTSYYVCPLENGVCQSYKSFISKNVSLIDQDSLIDNNRKNGPFAFKGSAKRYYADQIKIPNTNYTIFLAVGIDNSTFQASIRQINTSLLIFSLLLVIVLILGINFIKPVVSSYKERLSQMDLVSVAFSIGILIAVLVVFGIISYWDNTIKSRNEKDLKELVGKIDASFDKQITAYKNWKNKPLFKNEWKKSKNKFTQIYLETNPENIYVNKHPLFLRSLEKWKNSKNIFWLTFLKVHSKTISISGKVPNIRSDLENFTEESRLFNHLDNYFRMDGDGLITTDLNTSKPEIRRKYAERIYFQILQHKNKDKKKYNLLTAVYSREKNKYQWIYAEKNQQSEDIGINGIAFRQYFSKEIILPPGTGYMIIDKNGEVLMQNDTEKNLYQNLLYGSNKSPELTSLLSGVNQKSFEIEYQGIPYQVYAKKITTKIDSPVYILGIRDLSHLNRLSLFTFSNGFLISLFYGFFILLITYIYSALFYAGRLSLFSNHHFYHLFPDNSRTQQYKLLLIVNSIAILLGVIISLLSSPSIALVFCIIIGFNLVIINLITLNIRTSNSKRDLTILVLILFFLTVCLLFIIFYFNSLSLAIIALFGAHTVLLFYYRDWRKGQNINLVMFKDENKGVNRKAYTRFLTARLLYHFAVFPFVLISAFYVNEINDFASYYCSSNQIKEQNQDSSKKNIISAYSCNCNGKSNEQPLIVPNCKDDVVQKTNIGFFDRPALFEIKKFTVNSFSNKYYVNSKAIIQNRDIWDSLGMVFLLFIVLSFLTLLIYHLLNYYSNDFFFYDLMQAYSEKYYLSKKSYLANNHIFIPMVNNHDIKELIQVLPPHKITIIPKCDKYGITIHEVFDLDTNNEISPYLRMDFILNYNQNKFAPEYNKIWNLLPDDETRNVLYDFAQDHFVNYKNKGIVMNLMEKGIIDCHQLTGRLKIMSLSFRIFVLSKNRENEFITKFKSESKNGTFSKLKIPIFIVAISALVLLMYLNKDSYDRIAVMGGSIVSVIALLNKFLEANKSL